jgi:transmembrane sensor
VWLNAGSRLEVSLGRDARRVEMADGEALFDVTHDPARPFLITAGDRQVRVVGTRFNLRHRDGEFALTVSRGVVEVRPTGSAATPTRVMAGQSLVRRRGSATSVLSAASPDTAFAWTRGQLVYSDAPLSEVAADLSRSLGTPIRVADAATGQIPFTGVLALDDRTQVLRRLEAYAPVRAEQDPAGTVLRRR